MHIAINCRSFLKRQYTGIGRYTYNLVKSFSEIDRDNRYSLYVQKKHFDFKRKVPRFDASNMQVKVDWLGRGIARTLAPVDIYHSPSPDFIRFPEVRVVVTVHDLVYKRFPEGHTPEACAITERHLQEISSRADRVICCSRNTAEDLCHFFPSFAGRVSLVYQGVDKQVFYPLSDDDRRAAEKILKAKGIDGPFMLFVGTREPRKNLYHLIEAVARIKHKKGFTGKLVLAGMKGWMTEDFASELAKHGLNDTVVSLGYVTDALLRALYNQAVVFVFPSYYEGFGFPILEAFSCGTAVVTSKTSSCGEIAGDAALTVDPANPHEIADAVLRVWEDKDFRCALQKRGRQRSKEFSFTQTAEQTLQVYQDVMRGDVRA